MTHALHRLNAIASPANAAYSVSELTYQLRSTSASVLFTCVHLLPVALEAAAAANISKDHIFILDMPGQTNNNGFVALSTLIDEGKHLPPLPPLRWVKEQGKRQVAYICFSSGTSGLPVSFLTLDNRQFLLANVNMGLERRHAISLQHHQ